MRIRLSTSHALGILAVIFTAALLTVALSSGRGDHQKSVLVLDVSTQSTEQLLASARTEPVCRQLLKREDVNQDSLQAAFIRLTRLTGETTAGQLTLLMHEPENDPGQVVASNLCRLASLFSGHQRVQLLQSVRELSISSQSPAVQRTAMATWLILAADRDKVFQLLDDKGQLSELLAALPLVVPESLHYQLYDHIKPILSPCYLDYEGDQPKNHDSGLAGKLTSGANAPAEVSTELQKIAISVCAKLHGRETEKAIDLFALFTCRELRSAVIESIAMLPANAIPKQQFGLLAAELIAFIAEQPSGMRTSESAQQALQLGWRISEMLSDDKKHRLQKRLTELSN